MGDYERCHRKKKKGNKFSKDIDSKPVSRKTAIKRSQIGNSRRPRSQTTGIKMDSDTNNNFQRFYRSKNNNRRRPQRNNNKYSSSSDSNDTELSTDSEQTDSDNPKTITKKSNRNNTKTTSNRNNTKTAKSNRNSTKTPSKPKKKSFSMNDSDTESSDSV